MFFVLEVFLCYKWFFFLCLLPSNIHLIPKKKKFRKIFLKIFEIIPRNRSASYSIYCTLYDSPVVTTTPFCLKPLLSYHSSYINSQKGFFVLPCPLLPTFINVSYEFVLSKSLFQQNFFFFFSLFSETN